MTKKETETQTRLLDLLQANTRALEKVFDLLIRISGPPLISGTPIYGGQNSAGHPVAPEQQDKPEDSPEETPPPKEAETEITVEYIRKAMKAIQTKISKEEAKEFLAQFDGAKTIPKLDKKHYETFVAEATKIMKGE